MMKKHSENIKKGDIRNGDARYNRDCASIEVRNFVIFADDATLFIEENQTDDDTEARLGRYRIALEKRNLTNLI